VEFVDVAAVLSPDQAGKHDRRDREHAKDRRPDAEAREDGTVVVAGRRALVVGHGREATGRASGTLVG
jgi:hypothetical protein